MPASEGYYSQLLRLELDNVSNGGTTCQVNISQDVLAQTALVSESVAASFALAFYVVVLAMTVLAACCSSCCKMLSTQTTSILFLVGAIMVSVNIFTNENDLAMKMYYRIAAGAAIGILYVIIGALVFFQKPMGCNTTCRPIANQPCTRHHSVSGTLATQQPSMGLVVSGITAPLLVIELFLVLGTRAKTGTETPKYLRFWDLIIADKSIYMLQKFIQVIIYVFLRNKTTRVNQTQNVQFYFKVIAFFNVEEWLDSVVNSDTDLQLSKAELVYGPAFEIIETLYKALLIDYRLLCALLFLEHALVLGEEEETPQQRQARELYEEASLPPRVHSERIIENTTAEDRQKRTAGYILGSMCIFAQVFCLGGYLHKLALGAWVHTFASVVDVFLIICGALLIHLNKMVAQDKKHASKGISIMVCCLGAFGMTDYIMKATLSGFWSMYDVDPSQAPYFGWISFKFAVRAVTTAFLMFLFATVSTKKIGDADGALVKPNHFLIPTLMLGIFSEFVGSAIDQYVGLLDAKLRCEIKEASLALLFEAGPPMHLGFCIHVFLHFLILQRRLGRAKVALSSVQRQNGSLTAPLLGPDISQWTGQDAGIDHGPQQT